MTALPWAPLVEVHRGGLVESVHFGRIVVLDADGDVIFSRGDIHASIYPRSAVKPLQAAAMVQAGCPVRDSGLALAASSHSGEPLHIETVMGVLAAAGLAPTDLANVPDFPLGDAAREAYLRVGGVADSVHQNCSGKHAAMLATCVANHWPTVGYLSPDHPLQRAIRSGIELICRETTSVPTTDGCGAPLVAISLTALARGFSAVAVAAPHEPAGVVAGAMRAHPELVGGTGRDVTELMRAVPGCVAKDGAEGVYAIGLPDGCAVAVKLADGGTRGRLPALLAGLSKLGLTPAIPIPPVLGGGHPVGAVSATF